MWTAFNTLQNLTVFWLLKIWKVTSCLVSNFIILCIFVSSSAQMFFHINISFCQILYLYKPIFEVIWNGNFTHFFFLSAFLSAKVYSRLAEGGWSKEKGRGETSRKKSMVKLYVYLISLNKVIVPWLCNFQCPNIWMRFASFMKTSHSVDYIIFPVTEGLIGFGNVHHISMALRLIIICFNVQLASWNLKAIIVFQRGKNVAVIMAFVIFLSRLWRKTYLGACLQRKKSSSKDGIFIWFLMSLPIRWTA